MRRLVLAGLLAVGVAGCSDATRQPDGARTGKPGERPPTALPARAPSDPGGAYSRTGFDDDPRIDPSRSGFAPETQKGTVVAAPHKGGMQIVDRNGEKIDLRLTPHTRVERAGQRLGVEDLSEGKEVRASYYFDGHDRFVDEIELVAPDRDRKR